jgi:hypothetical protein
MTANLKSLYYCSALDLYLLVASQYSGYTEIFPFSPLLQINSGLVPRLDEDGFKEFFFLLFIVSQPTDAL